MDDFLSSHIRTFQDEPRWYWWETLNHALSYIPLSLRLRSFNPIIRLSNAALGHIHYALKHEQWSGHHEVLLPTLLFLEGFKIRDFGGNGSFVDPETVNKFYMEDASGGFDYLNSGTMRFRPPITEMPEKNKLYHPVKT